MDYRKLNGVTQKDVYPLPRITDTLDALGGSRLFSTLDLTAGYWQVELDEEAKERSAFVTRSGLWRWKVLPFGLTSRPSTFEKLMENVLRPLQCEKLLIYLYNIIVFSKTVDEHLQRLDEVFKRLKAAGLKLKPRKCHLFATVVQNWPRPRHQTYVRAFLGMTGYYRRFIIHCAELSKPLAKITLKNETFIWMEDCDRAFNELKEALKKSPVLAYLDFNLPFILDTDISNVGTGAVLSQLQEGVEKPIAFFFKMMNLAGTSYCATRKELLAIIRAVKNFHTYFYGR